MSSILIEQKYCKIIDEPDKDFLRSLDEHLSFKYAGYQFSPAFKYHNWDGTEHLLSRKLEFLTGLLDRVLEFYRRNNKEVNLINKIPAFQPGQEIDLSDNLKKLGIVPYDYQIEAVNWAMKYDRLIYKHGTGAGKSISAALITAKFGLPTIVWVIGKDLLYQFHGLFSKLFNQKIGIIGDGLCDAQSISIVSVWTAGRALDLKKNEILLDDAEDEKIDLSNKDKIITLIKEAKIHHFDECHISAAKTIRTIYKNTNPAKIFGYSGTPIRDDNADLLIEGIFSKKMYEITSSELIKRGILAKPFIKFVYVKGQAHYTDNYNKVYSENIINNHYRNNLIVLETKKLLDKGYQVLVLYKNIIHGKILLSLFKEKEIDTEFLNGKDNTDKRNNVKQNLLTKKTNCVIASMIYDIGISIETLNALVLAGSGKSSCRCLQRVGRVIRDGPNKPYVAIVDFFDDVKFLKKHSLIRKSIYETEKEFVIKFPDINNK